jgi:hypothetical protein
MEAMIKYYEGETLGLGGKTAGSPGAGPRSPAAPAPLPGGCALPLCAAECCGSIRKAQLRRCQLAGSAP